MKAIIYSIGKMQLLYLLLIFLLLFTIVMIYYSTALGAPYPMSLVRENWMERLYTTVPQWKNLPLAEICIPGTHDSATGCLIGSGVQPPNSGACYYSYKNFSDYMLGTKKCDAVTNWRNIGCMLKKASLRPFWFAISPYTIAWTKNQQYPILNQLKNGVRYFDLRMWVDKGGVYFRHGSVVFNYSLKEVLSGILRFLNRNTKEIVILKMAHILSDIDTKSASRLISKTTISILGNKIVKPKNIPQNLLPSMHIKHILRQGQVIISQQDVQPEYSDYMYTKKLIASPYKSCDIPCSEGGKCKTDKNLLPVNWKTLENNYLSCYAPFPSENKLNVLQAHMQYSGKNVTQIMGKNILKFSIMPSSSNMLSYTKRQKINEKLANWLLKNSDNSSYNLNIIQVDNYEPDLLSTIIKVNKQKATKRQ